VRWGEMISKEELEKLYWEEGLTQREIAERLGCSQYKVQKWMQIYDIPRRPHGARYPQIELTTEQYEILYGLILGDGYLDPYYKNAHFSIASKHLEFILHLHYLFPDALFPPKWLRRRVKYGHIKYLLYTISHPIFTELLSLFYPDGEKTIPEIELTPTVFLYWFLGDGSYCKSKNDVHITSGFTRKEYRPVIEWLASEGVEARWKKKSENERRRRSRGKGYLCIYKKDSVRQFFELIGPPPVRCFAYKWPSEFAENREKRSEV